VSGTGFCAWEWDRDHGVAAPAWLYAEYAEVGRGRMELPIYDTAAAGVTRTAVMPT